MSDYLDQLDLSSFVKLLPPIYQDVSILSYGRRGIVLKAKKDDLSVAIKMLRPYSEAKNALLLEAKYLSEANKLGIGPSLIESSEDFVVMDFVEGLRIDNWLVDSTYEETLGMLSVLFHQLFSLDKVGINKSEMTNPYKHVIVKKDLLPVMIDFERARFNLKPQNVTQFAQYLMSAPIHSLLLRKGILLNLAAFKDSIKSYSKSREEFAVVSFL